MGQVMYALRNVSKMEVLTASTRLVGLDLRHVSVGLFKAKAVGKRRGCKVVQEIRQSYQ